MTERKAAYNNKQNQMLTKLSIDTKVEGWALWFCLPPLVAIMLIDKQ